MRKSRQFSAYSSQLRTGVPKSGASFALFLPALTIALWLLLPCPVPTRAQNLDKTVMNVDEEVTAFAYAPDGRIVFSVRRSATTLSSWRQTASDDAFSRERNSHTETSRLLTRWSHSTGRRTGTSSPWNSSRPQWIRTMAEAKMHGHCCCWTTAGTNYIRW